MKKIENNRTKIVATIGPSSSNYKTLKDLIINGVDVVRLNFSHGDKEDHKKHCPKIKWEQPSIEEYKKDLESKLPSNCKK